MVKWSAHTFNGAKANIATKSSANTTSYLAHFISISILPFLSFYVMLPGTAWRSRPATFSKRMTRGVYFCKRLWQGHPRHLPHTAHKFTTCITSRRLCTDIGQRRIRFDSSHRLDSLCSLCRLNRPEGPVTTKWMVQWLCVQQRSAILVQHAANVRVGSYWR